MNKELGPVVQCIVSLTSSLVVKLLTALVSTVSNSQLILLKKMRVAFASHFFSKNINVYAIFNDQSFNYRLTNNINTVNILKIRTLKRLTK